MDPPSAGSAISRPPLPPPSAATAAANPILRPTFTPPFQTKKPLPSSHQPVLPPPSLSTSSTLPCSPPPPPPSTPPPNTPPSSSPLPLPPPIPNEKLLFKPMTQSVDSALPPTTSSSPSASPSVSPSPSSESDEETLTTATSLPSTSQPPPKRPPFVSRSPLLASSPNPNIPSPSPSLPPSRSPPPFRSSNSFTVPSGASIQSIIPNPSGSAPSKRAPGLPATSSSPPPSKRPPELPTSSSTPPPSKRAPTLPPSSHFYSKTPPPSSSRPPPMLTRGTSFCSSASDFEKKKEKKKLAINIRPRSVLGNDGGTLGGEEGEGEGERVMGGEDSSPPALAREEALPTSQSMEMQKAKLQEQRKIKRSISLTNATKGMVGVKKLGQKEVAEKLRETPPPKEKEQKPTENKEKRKSFWGGKKKEIKEGGGSHLGPGAGLVGLEKKKGACIGDVEIICDKLIEFFDQKMQSSEGLFRISGPAEKVAQLRDDVLAGKFENIMNSEENNEHTRASVMKVIYREAEELIVPNEEYEKLLNWHDSQSSLPDEEAFIDLSGLKAILDTLDEVRLRILKKMTRFLAQVATYSDLNMMTPANLGIVFSPNVIQTPPDADVFRQFEDASKTKFLMQLLIENTESLFQ